MALAALVVLLAPYFFAVQTMAQTEIPPPGAALSQSTGGGQLSPGAAATQSTTPANPYQDPPTNLIQQSAEQNTQGVVSNVNQLLQGANLGSYNDVYQGMHQFFGDDIVSNLFSNIGQLIGRWITEFVNGWISDTVQFLSAFLRTFVLNPNIAVNGLQNTPGSGNTNDDISPYIRQGADVMYGIAVDLLLLLFILCIWKYWAEASWRGAGSLMGAVGRLIFTAGLMLAWPTLYAFEIQITNEMIKAIYFNSADQVVMLDAALAAAVKGGLLAGAGLLANAFAPVIGAVAGGALGGGAGGLVLGTVGDIVSFVGLILYLVLGAILIAELVYILVLKAIQTALLTAQYMFAPIFLVFFATPDTESICSGFVRSFVEVSLWTFVWVGLLKIMVIVLFSQFNPWGKIVLAVGVLQLMIQVPSFLARAQISPASDFISAGLISGGLMKGFSALSGAVTNRTGQAFDYLMNQKYSARGTRNSQKVGMDGLPKDAQNPGLLKGFQDTAKNKVQGGPSEQPLKGADGKTIKAVKDKNAAAAANQPAGAAKDLNNKNKSGQTAATPPNKKPNAGVPGAGLGKNAKVPTTPGGLGAQAKTGANAPGTAADAAKAGTDALKRGAKIAGVAGAAGGALAAFEAARAGQQSPEQRASEAAKNKEAQDQMRQELAQAQHAADLQGLSEEDKVKKAAAEAAAAAGGKTKHELKTKPGEQAAGAGDKKKDGTPTPPDMRSAAAQAAAQRRAGMGANAGTAGTQGTPEAKIDATRGGTPAKPGATAERPKDQSMTVPGAPTRPTTSEQEKQNAAGLPSGVPTDEEGRPLQQQREGQRLNLKVDPKNPQAAPTRQTSQTGTPEVKPPVAGQKPAAGAQTPEQKAAAAAQAGKTGATAGGAAQSLQTGRQAINLGVQGGQDQHAQQDVHYGFDAQGNRIVLRAGQSTAQQRGAGNPSVVGGPVPPAVPQKPTVPTDAAQRMVAGMPTAPAPGSHTVGNIPGVTVGGGGMTVPTDVTGTMSTVGPNGERINIRVQGATPPGGPRPPAAGNIGVVPASGATGAMAARSLNPAAVAQGRAFDPTSTNLPPQLAAALGEVPGSGLDAGMQIPNVFSMFDQPNYRWVPGRGLAIDIRTAAGPTMGKSPTGKGELVGNGKGTSHVRFAENATTAQKAMQLMAGGYANVMTSDVQALDAARQSCIDAGEDGPHGVVERMAAGYMAYSGKSFKQTVRAKERFQNSMFKHAAIGSAAYVAGETGNAYTQYLETRYGPMTAEQQAWGIHIFSDPTSPESGWSPRVVPATETLVSAGIPITAGYRAAAANPAVLKQPAWGRGPAIRGVAAYVDALADRMCGPETHPFVRDALVGRLAPNVGTGETAAAMAIMLEAPTTEKGEEIIRSNPNLVQHVAQLAPYFRDASEAYKSLRGVNEQVTNRGTTTRAVMVSSSSGSAGSAGGAAPPPPPPPAPIGGGSVGPFQIIDNEYIAAPGGGAQGAAAAATGFVSGNIPQASPQMQQQVNMRFDPRTGMAAPIRRTVQTNVSGHIVGSPQVNMHGTPGGQVVQPIDVDVVPSHNPGSAPTPSLPNIPGGTREVRQQLNINFVPSRHTTMPGQRMTVQAPAGNVVSGSPQVSMHGGGTAGGYVDQTTQVDAVQQASGSMPAGAGADATGIALSESQKSAHSLHYSQQFIIDMISAGFRNDQLQDRRVVQTALQCYERDGGASLPVAAVVAQKLGPADFNVHNVEVVEAMVDAGWNAQQISRPDVITADAILQSGGGYPTPQYVRKVRYDPQFQPRPGIRQQVPQMLAQQAAMGQIDRILRELPW